MLTEEPCQYEICKEEGEEEKRLRRELARLKKKNKQDEEKNQQTRREIEMIQKKL